MTICLKEFGFSSDGRVKKLHLNKFLTFSKFQASKTTRELCKRVADLLLLEENEHWLTGKFHYKQHEFTLSYTKSMFCNEAVERSGRVL